LLEKHDLLVQIGPVEKTAFFLGIFDPLTRGSFLTEEIVTLKMARRGLPDFSWYMIAKCTK
jgi:hypothetical protein